MKKQSTFALLALVLVILSIANGCQKQHARFFAQFTGADSNQILIQAARAYMAQQPPVLSRDSTHPRPFPPGSILRWPLWEQAQVQNFAFGKGVVLPVNYQNPLSVHVGPDQVLLSANQITWLLLYQDAQHQWHAEVITRVPINSITAFPFLGIIHVEDWQRQFLKGYFYNSDTAIRLSLTGVYKRDPAAKPTTFDIEAAKAPVCTSTDWYACSSVGGVFEGCEYEYTVEECSSGGGGDGDGPSAGGGPTAGDYASVGTGGSAASGGSAAVSKITPDASIADNPIIACVWNHLMSAQLTDGLRAILSAFGDNQIYNINFTVSATVPGDGQTSYQGGNNFLVQINASEANDPTYSRIYLASTFIHEAFHSKLRQKALATFGSTVISTWPKPIDDMDLSELANYFEAESKQQNIWESVTHDWMVNNIDLLGASLQQYVQTFYQATYAQVGSNPTVYQDLMYMGLQTSTLYQEDIVAKGLQPSVQAGWGKLNEGGKCQD